MNAVAESAISPQQIASLLPVHRLTVGQYLAMNEAGILSEDDRVELIEGVMVENMPGNPSHAAVQRYLMYWLIGVLDRHAWLVSIKQPIVLRHSVLLPDVCVLRSRPGDYADQHPVDADVALVIEVSDLTMNTDRVVKRRVYAGAGIAQMWIVNLIDRQIEVYTDPDRAAGVYRAEAVHPADGTIALTLDGAAIASCPVADLLP
jgi:hypothetical protein